MILYEEKQRISKKILFLLLPILSILLYGCFKQVILGVPFGSKPMPNAGLIATTIIFFLIILLILSVTITIKINESQFIYNWNGSDNSTVIKLDDIAEYKAITFPFVLGYGYHFSPKYGTVNILKGKKAVIIILKNGDKYLMGTSNPDIIVKLFSNYIKT